MSNTLRVLVADDHPLFREGVVHSLAGKTGMTVVGQAANGEEALRLCRNLLPDIILLDIAMPGQGGLAAANEIAVACPVTKIVMLTVSEHQDDLLSAFKAGARGYVLKGISARELVNILRSVAAGDVYVSPSLAAGMLMELTHDRSPDPLTDLTEREREILQLLAEGLTNREIGERLHLAEKTIKHYMTNVLGKLHVRSRVEAALLAVRHEGGKET
ncbi:MAG: response regulator transcription factor [Gammaproteobacteria bacterium]|nr:response regulator transcription factor [Gammaproteobacteria bacterium]